MPYIGAVEHAWGADAPDFAQLVTLYGASLPGPARLSAYLASDDGGFIWGQMIAANGAATT